MSTAEALEAITDRGKFELLVKSILWIANYDYSAIIHTGNNAQRLSNKVIEVYFGTGKADRLQGKL